MTRKSGKTTSATQDVEGYIHNVSPIKTPPSGNRYFNFKIQEHSDTTRVVCFNPDKRETLKQKQEAKSTVRILNVSPQKRKYEPDTREYKMVTKSKVINTTNMPFPWAEIDDDKPKEISISDIFTSSAGDVVSLKATVFSKSDSETVYSHTMRKSLHMCNIVLADGTGAIRATLWESMIGQVSEGVSYEFNKFKINFFNQKYLNGTPESKVNETKVVEVPPEILPAAEELKPKAKQTKDVNGRCAIFAHCRQCAIFASLHQLQRSKCEIR
jgi:ssDNA-binding replication factor A large subunit